ncbi:putative membrane protein [Salibacterium salarium]|uniref:TIGR03943 family putative permease subunit n=1 Tax=Salibacterium salarium TaxID=284579 RepID=UPI0027820458|nr:TIGR03943 family protein [Salibacterium salarium]MDQ0300352.1 putative membrane protein [Salibacterium salarium]
MHFSFQHFLRASILGAFAAFFLYQHLTGDITNYINPKYGFMSKMAGGFLVFLFLIQLSRVWRSSTGGHVHCSSSCDHNHGYDDSFLKKFISYSILIYPLIMGFASAPQTLDSSFAENKGTMLPQAKDSEADSISSDEIHDQEPLPNNNFIREEDYQKRMQYLKESSVINMEKDIFSSYYNAIRNNSRDFVGKPIKVQGFIYREEGLHFNQVVISRFIITHCIADAGVMGLLTEFEQAGSFEEDTWLEIEGELDVTVYNGVELPVIKAKRGRIIEEPSNPYIYPVLREMTN